MRMDAERYFEAKLQNTDFLLEDRNVAGDDVQQSIFADSYGGLNQPKPAKPTNVVVTLECTLEEFYCGSIKQASYERNVVQFDAKTTQAQREIQQVEVKPGFSESTELVFKKLGNQSPGYIHADLIIKFKQLPHATMVRKGHNLIYKHKVTLQQAFESNPVSFRALDGRSLTYACDEQIAPQTCKLIEDEGMPIQGTAEKGSLFLMFEVEFPTQFTLETK